MQLMNRMISMLLMAAMVIVLFDTNAVFADGGESGNTQYTATANGTANATNSTLVTLEFESPVPDLNGDDIMLTPGSASATKGALTAVGGTDGAQYNLAISGVTAEGDINLQIVREGVDNAVKTVSVHKAPITFTAANVGGTAFVRDSASITLTFNAAVSDLSVDDITLSPGTPAAVSNNAAAMAGKGALTKISDTKYELALVNISKTGTLGLQVNKPGVEANKKNILVNAKVDKTALQAVPPREYFPQNITDLPKSTGLNDLFEFLDPAAGTDGRVDSPADWNARRDELKDLIQYYYYGRKYPTSKSAITVNNQTNQINVTIADNGSTVSASLGSVTVPSGTAPEGGWPVIIAFGFGQTSTATANGYAVISVTNWGSSRTGNYYKLYPFDPYSYDFNTGSIMTAAWSVSRIIDAMEISAAANDGVNQWNINPSKSITTGVSINGKYALMSAAMDDRVGAAAPVDSGQSGLSSFRYTAEGKLFYYDSPIDKIYRRNQKGLNSIQYSGESFWMGLGTAAGFHQQTDMDYMPFDSHAVEALMAPRPLIGFTADNNFDWTTPPASILAMTAAKEVYEFLGSDNIAVRTRDGAHAIQNRDVPFIIAVMDKTFSDKPLEVKNLFNDNYGVGTYDKISDMSIYPYDIDSSYLRWSRPGKYTLWAENEIVTAGIPTTIRVHSDAQQVKLTILDADNKPTDDTWTASVEDGIAEFALTGQQVKIGRYEVTTVGAVKDSKTVYFQGVDLATALRHGTARNDNGAAVMYGFTSKINKDLVEVYADGVRLTQSLQEDTEKAWILNYGVTTNPNENNLIKNDAFSVITLKKLQMEALPGSTFEISIDKSKLANNQETVSWSASAAVQKIGPQPDWPPYPNSASDDGTRPVIPPTTTNFDADVDFALGDGGHLANGASMTVSFSKPMYRGDFGIGVDFSDDFTLAWADDNQSVDVTFNDITKNDGETGNVYIMRLADTEGNSIAAPIQHSFTMQTAAGATLSGTDSVPAGDSFALAWGLTGVTGDVFAEDMTITYDANELELIAPPASKDGSKFVVVDYLADTPGVLRVLGVHLGEGQTSPNGDLINLSFRAKASAQGGQTDVTVTNVVVADGDGVETALEGAVHTVHIVVISKATLNALINEAQNTYDQAVEGKLVGQYPSGSKALLQTAINQATLVANNLVATQVEIDSAVAQLNEALQAFEASVIKKMPTDYNNDEKVSVGDLAVMAKSYGMTSADAGWEQVKHFDMNDDGVIDIVDLAALARMIFEW